MRIICLATNERMSPTRRPTSSSSMSPNFQRARSTSNTKQSQASYRVYTNTEPATSSFQLGPSKVVTQVTEETQVIQIPRQQPQYQQQSEISYTVQDKKPKFEPVSFQVSTVKENGKPATAAVAKDDNSDPNPFKIFGAKLRSRPTQGIVPSYDDQSTTNYSQQASSSTYSQYQQSASQQPTSSSFPSSQSNMSNFRQ